MLANALPAGAHTYTLGQVVDLDLLTMPCICYRRMLSGAACQLLSLRRYAMSVAGDWFETTMFNTESGQIDDMVLRSDAPVVVVPEDEEVAA